MTAGRGNPLRVLVVDDSAYNRQTIAAMLETTPGVVVVGRASNGREALHLAFELLPDVITLDLEMPEMDGFAFLRLLMGKRPIPVIVVSGYAERENIFRALELGALDFVAKPGRDAFADLRQIQGELLGKVEMVRRLQVVRLRERAQALLGAERTSPRSVAPSWQPTPGGLRAAVAIAASTGGPPALQQLLAGLPGDLPAAILIAQHMPPRFTRAFAERMHRLISLRVVEAEEGMVLEPGVAYVAPGSANLDVTQGAAGPQARVTPVAPVPAVITPSADSLFRSAGELFGTRLCVAVLTGMGSDGRDGAMAAKACGARVLAEDPELAVMPGMPQSVIASGVVDEIWPLEQMAGAILRFVESHL